MERPILPDSAPASADQIIAEVFSSFVKDPDFSKLNMLVVGLVDKVARANAGEKTPSCFSRTHLSALQKAFSSLQAFIDSQRKVGKIPIVSSSGGVLNVGFNDSSGQFVRNFSCEISIPTNDDSKSSPIDLAIYFWGVQVNGRSVEDLIVRATPPSGDRGMPRFRPSPTRGRRGSEDTIEAFSQRLHRVFEGAEND